MGTSTRPQAFEGQQRCETQHLPSPLIWMTEISICLRLSKYLYYILACGLGCWKDWGDFESHSAFSAKCPGDQTMRDTPVNREAAALVSHCREDKILRSVSIPKHVLTAPWAKSRILLCNFTLLAICTEPRCHGCQDRVCNCHLPVQNTPWEP